jgi:hypothetical protein
MSFAVALESTNRPSRIATSTASRTKSRRRSFEKQVNVQIRILCRERGNTWDDRTEPKARGHTHPHQSAQIPAPTNAVFRLIEGPQDRLDASQKLAACLRRYDRASAA